jgi:hypothetical protein
VFLANSAFVQATLLWVTLTPALYRFHRKAKRRWGEAVAHMCALSGTHFLPTPASQSAVLHLTPALKRSAFRQSVHACLYPSEHCCRSPAMQQQM